MSGKAAANTLIFRIDILLFAATRPKRAEPKKLVSGLLRELICHSLDRLVGGFAAVPTMESLLDIELRLCNTLMSVF